MFNSAWVDGGVHAVHTLRGLFVKKAKKEKTTKKKENLCNNFFFHFYIFLKKMLPASGQIILKPAMMTEVQKSMANHIHPQINFAYEN